MPNKKDSRSSCNFTRDTTPLLSWTKDSTSMSGWDSDARTNSKTSSFAVDGISTAAFGKDVYFKGDDDVFQGYFNLAEESFDKIVNLSFNGKTGIYTRDAIPMCNFTVENKSLNNFLKD